MLGNFESTTTADFTTNKETDFTKNVDVSKFKFTLDVKSNKETEKAFVDANITYSLNDFFDVKLIQTEDAIAIGSNEVLDKYIATKKENLANSISRASGIETEVNSDIANETVNKFLDTRINIDEAYKSQKLKEYADFLIEKIPDEAITITPASPITINSAVVNTDAYTLLLDGATYKEVATGLLNKLKSDEDLLSKIVVSTENSYEEEPEENQTPKPITTIKPVGGETEEHQTSLEIETEEITEEEEETEELDLEDIKIESSDFKLIEQEDSFVTELLAAFISNQKLDMSVQEIQNKITNVIKNINSKEEFKVTIYVKNVEGEPKETVKILAKLPTAIDLDIEYPEKSKFKITFLQDIIEEYDDGTENKINMGNSFEVKRTDADLQTKFNIVINNIKEKKVVAKLQLDLTTQGTKTAKKYVNDAIVKYNDSESDFKINIKNIINFQKPNIEQELNDENAIFVDDLSDDEISNLYITIFEKIMDLYSQKIINMDFMNVNSLDGTAEPQESPIEIGERNPAPADSDEENENSEEASTTERHITKRQARDLLIAKIEEMMSQAEEYDEEFSILNLQLLPSEIDGNEVVTEVNEEEAIVKIAEYTFRIDKEFMLSED